MQLTMPDSLESALARLRSILASQQLDEEFHGLVTARDRVLARFQPMFLASAIPALTEKQFHEFLLLRNNRHWSGLHRMGPVITKDMDALRGALVDLLDESRPVGNRLSDLIPWSGVGSRVKRLGKAVLTAILLVAHPDRYCVWNGTSEGALRELGLWPDFERGATTGERYEQINGICLEVSKALGVDLWTLDACWWRVLKPLDAVEAEPDEDPDLIDELDLESGVLPAEAATVTFGLERHLHDFLLDNWEHTELGAEWDLAEEGGDIRNYGYERPTPVGRIDLLARHKAEPRWLVIELKRGRTSDRTLGQVQRYMGWVMEELAEPGELVEGLIIALADDLQLRYALRAAQNVGFMRYEVDFRLVQGK